MILDRVLLIIALVILNIMLYVGFGKVVKESINDTITYRDIGSFLMFLLGLVGVLAGFLLSSYIYQLSAG